MADRIAKVKSALAAVSVEPVVFIYCYTYFVFSSATTNLYLQKVCMPDAPPLDTDAVCEDPVGLATSTDINTLRTMMKTFLPGIVVLLAGIWRDRTGKTKPLLLLAFFGEIFVTVVSLLAFIYWSASTWIFAAIESLICGVSGGMSIVIMGANCIVIENSTPENRTSRISYLVSSLMLSGIIASGTSGLLLSAFGYQNVYILVIVLHVLTIILTFAFVKDKPKEIKNGQSSFNLSTLKTVCCDSGENMICIWLVLIGSLAVNTTFAGETNVSLFFMEKQFGYTMTQAGYYSSYRMAIAGISSLILSQIMTQVFKMSDFTIAILSGLLTLLGAVSMVFATTFMELVLFAFFDILKPTLLTVMRSILSKLLHPEQIGVFFGMESVIGAVLPLGVLPLYDMVFNATITTLPGAFYLVSAAFELVTFICVCITCYLYKEPLSNDEKPTTSEESISDCEKGCDNVKESQLNNSNVKIKE